MLVRLLAIQRRVDSLGHGLGHRTTRPFRQRPYGADHLRIAYLYGRVVHDQIFSIMITWKFQASRGLAEHLGVDRSSVSLVRGPAVPGPVAAAFEALLLFYQLTDARPNELGKLDRARRVDGGATQPRIASRGERT